MRFGAPMAFIGAVLVLASTGFSQSRGYMTTPQELAGIKQKADNGIQPHNNAVSQVLTAALATWNFTLDSTETCGGADDPAWIDEQGISTLYAKALAYRLTGNEAYAGEVRSILEQIMTRVLAISTGATQCQLNFAWGTPELVASADLIEDYWKNQTCTGPTSTVYGQNQIGTGNCKALFQNWLIKNPYYIISYDINTGKWGNWEAAAGNAALYIADYLWDRPSAQLVGRNPYGANFVDTPAVAYARNRSLVLAGMRMEVTTARTTGKCDKLTDSYQSPNWPPRKAGITERGIIPEDARRQETYCNIPAYQTGLYENYPQVHLGNLLQACELMYRRGSKSCYDQAATDDIPAYTYIGPDKLRKTTHLYPGRGSVERAIDAIVIEAKTEFRRRGAMAVAYRYYLLNKKLPLTDLAVWKQYVATDSGRCAQDICYGGLTHALQAGEIPTPPPVVAPPQ